MQVKQHGYGSGITAAHLPTTHYSRGLPINVAPGYEPVLVEVAYQHIHQQQLEHARVRERLLRRAPPSREMHRQISTAGGAGPQHRAAPDLRYKAAERTSTYYPIGKHAARPTRERTPEARVASLLCGAGEHGNARIGPFDVTSTQRVQDISKPSTYTWSIARPAIGLKPGDTRGLMRAREDEVPHRWRNAPGLRPPYTPPPRAQTAPASPPPRPRKNSVPIVVVDL